ncbi:unnamed protein product [Meganyctiphanes norvegica]|uniref:Steroid 5-alpha reductase C-terminal domain-containing protein n=1 Tax=Meganyctiphanes norvegica TaxID=48144 RepID=A0AAV2PYB7_MEGNR
MSWILGISDWFMGLGNVTRLAVVDFSIQWVLGGIAVLKQTERYYDLAGSSTFLLLAYLNFQWNTDDHPRQVIQTGCICLWAFRLGSFLFTRVLKAGEDKRFTKIRVDPRRFFVAWNIQGVWVILTLLPSILGVSSTQQPPLVLRDYIGWSMWTVGFVTEVLADYQKTKWRNDPANKDKFITVGLWSISRHPNYFGEIMLWFGLYISASATFSGLEYLTVLCPVFNYLLITKLSGIPMLERYAEKKWGSSPQYQAYVRDTPALVPFLN